MAPETGCRVTKNRIVVIETDSHHLYILYSKDIFWTSFHVICERDDGQKGESGLYGLPRGPAAAY